MKKLITIGYIAAVLASGIGFAKADTIKVSVSTPTINSVQLCNIGAELFHDGIDIKNLVEALKASKLDTEDKLIVVNCFIAEMEKV
ncbi:hypothetical protein bas01_0063 [Escherichia phage AugustePiccard]|uniref:Uncharacterized protein n=1 Tax=Escherichia phage AugustePiccard TaxID=2851954 RepID=A0AAE7VP32_9CAUD|nr:hypothetical protein bas01_0063 [Escherichia phage AugustePiccard]